MARRLGTYAFTHATLLDGTEGMAPRPGTTVVVEGGRIASVAPDGQATLSARAQVIDVAGGYLLPGLVNMHVHLISTGAPVSSGGASKLLGLLDSGPGRMVARALVKRSAQQQLASGVTTVRGAGDPVLADIAVRDAIDEGRYLGPRILAPGWGVTVPNGHGAGSLATVVSTPDEARELVDRMVEAGANHIKIFVTGGVFDSTVAGEAGIVRMSPEIARVACEEAHRLGRPVMAHVESTEGVVVALEAGVDTVEHGARMTDQTIALYKGSAGTQLPGRPASVTCTISPALPYALLDPAKTHSTEIQKINGDIVTEGIIASARAALDAGIPVGLGTDSSCPYVTQYDMWREVAYFQRHVGVSSAFSLHTATQVNAQLVGLGDETGTIEVGKSADILVVGRDPLEDLSALREVRHVMVRGQLADKLKVKRMPELDEDLDYLMAQPAEAVLEACRADGAL